MMVRMTAAGLALLASGALAIAASPSPVDGQYAYKGSVGNTFEIQSSRLALRNSTDPQIQAFARHMIADHTKAQAELDRAASRAGADAGTFIDDLHGTKISAMSGLSGTEFDQTYVADQVAAHHETLQLLDDMLATGSDPGLRAWAAKTRPVVLRHLQMLGGMTDQS